MVDICVDEEMQIRLKESDKLLVPIFKCVSHPSRYQILLELYSGTKSFGHLQKITQLGRTATANHLKQLDNQELIGKPDRGLYQLTQKGREFLQVIAPFYDKWQIQELNNLRSVQQQYSQAFTPPNAAKNITTIQSAIFEPGWLSFVAAITSILKVLGEKVDYIDVGGQTGYIFLTNVAQHKLCPSGPTYFTGYIWKEMINAVSELGWDLESYNDSGSYPSGEQMNAEDHLRILKHFHWIRDALQTTRRPVVVWGLPIPEYGIVNGIDSNRYVCSTYRRLLGNDDTPLFYENLQSPGALIALKFQNPSNLIHNWTQEQRDLQAVKRIVTFLTKAQAPKGYVMGAQAYLELARNLEQSKLNKPDYHALSYQAECYHEAKNAARKYLSRIVNRYNRLPFASEIRAARNDINEVADFIRKFRELFPFKFAEKVNERDQAKGAAILRSIPPFEQSAIDHLSNALEIWENV